METHYLTHYLTSSLIVSRSYSPWNSFAHLLDAFLTERFTVSFSHSRSLALFHCHFHCLTNPLTVTSSLVVTDSFTVPLPHSLSHCLIHSYSRTYLLTRPAKLLMLFLPRLSILRHRRLLRWFNFSIILVERLSFLLGTTVSTRTCVLKNHGCKYSYIGLDSLWRNSSHTKLSHYEGHLTII